jgi:tRNA(Ile)-lysidine synthase
MCEPSALPRHLHHKLLPHLNATAWHVAFSGGLDSTVLLHLLANIPDHPPLTALHIHHGLQAAADAWPAHCQKVCDALDVPLRVINVQVADTASVEQAARQARYQAFATHLSPGAILFTGQHQDDQAETVLFRLMRGTGVRGLAGIPAQRSLGQGTLLRPLLDVPRSALLDYAQQHGLAWIEDPSNTDTQLSRNYLRHEVLPVLAQRWPQAATCVARAAAHLSEAGALLDELAESDLKAARSTSPFPWLQMPSLALAPLAALSEARQRNALQSWLAPLTRLPDAQHWASWLSLRDAGADAAPIWRLTDGEVHRAGDRVWWVSGQWSQPQPADALWSSPDKPMALADNGEVSWQGDELRGEVQIRYRQGGETMRLTGRGRRDLKRLLNESGLPAFVRRRLPLLFIDGELIAVANLPLSTVTNGRLLWLPPTSDQSLR